ncbi:hypothetical protein Ddc_20423 [Ditylenchus destructor]|nr:hypothetical protein Ddc_20423 [Ditylenchus destructor]
MDSAKLAVNFTCSTPEPLNEEESMRPWTPLIGMGIPTKVSDSSTPCWSEERQIIPPDNSTKFLFYYSDNFSSDGLLSNLLLSASLENNTLALSISSFDQYSTPDSNECSMVDDSYIVACGCNRKIKESPCNPPECISKYNDWTCAKPNESYEKRFNSNPYQALVIQFRDRQLKVTENATLLPVDLGHWENTFEQSKCVRIRMSAFHEYCFCMGTNKSERFCKLLEEPQRILADSTKLINKNDSITLKIPEKPKTSTTSLYEESNQEEELVDDAWRWHMIEKTNGKGSVYTPTLPYYLFIVSVCSKVFVNLTVIEMDSAELAVNFTCSTPESLDEEESMRPWAPWIGWKNLVNESDSRVPCSAENNQMILPDNSTRLQICYSDIYTPVGLYPNSLLYAKLENKTISMGRVDFDSDYFPYSTPDSNECSMMDDYYVMACALTQLGSPQIVRQPIVRLHILYDRLLYDRTIVRQVNCTTGHLYDH